MQTRKERNEILEFLYGDIHTKEQLAEILSINGPVKEEVVEKLFATITALRDDKEGDEIDREFNEILLRDMQLPLSPRNAESKPWYQRIADNVYSLFAPTKAHKIKESSLSPSPSPKEVKNSYRNESIKR